MTSRVAIPSQAGMADTALGRHAVDPHDGGSDFQRPEFGHRSFTGSGVSTASGDRMPPKTWHSLPGQQ